MALTDNIRGHWKVDETSGAAADSSGNGYTLSVNGTVNYVAGIINNCADFGTSNSGNALTIGNNLGIVGGNMSMSLWVKMRTEIGSGIQCFAAQSNATRDLGYEIIYDYNGGTRRIGFERARPGVTADNVYSTITLGTSSWTHLVMTYNGTDIEGYINGVSVGTTAASGDGTASITNTFAIGFRGWAGDEFASAYVDQVRVWDRAITSTEVAELYAEGVQSSPRFKTLLGVGK